MSAAEAAFSEDKSHAAKERKDVLNPERKYFCATHSDRPLDLKLCDLNYLEVRYSRPDRLPPSEPFGALLPAKTHSPFGGEVTIYDLDRVRDGQVHQVGHLRPESFKPQHAVWRNGQLWVLGTEHIEIYNTHLKSIGRIEDRWLAGGHTIVPDGAGRMLVSCSASDSVLAIDERTWAVVTAVRMPTEIYGSNYPLTRSDSVVDHYITNDLQTTHVNCAAPWRGGVLTSALIPGAIGWFGPDYVYAELLRGFVGCHGARAMPDGRIYFCDSCLGTLTILDDSMRVNVRLSTGSKWLHDAVHISDGVFAMAVYDDQSIWFMDTGTREIIQKIDCGIHGPPQFLSY